MDTPRRANSRHFSGRTWSSSGKAPRDRPYRSQRHVLRGVMGATSELAYTRHEEHPAIQNASEVF